MYTPKSHETIQVVLSFWPIVKKVRAGVQNDLPVVDFTKTAWCSGEVRLPANPKRHIKASKNYMFIKPSEDELL